MMTMTELAMLARISGVDAALLFEAAEGALEDGPGVRSDSAS